MPTKKNWNYKIPLQWTIAYLSMFNWDILPNAFLFNSQSYLTFSKVSTGITQMVPISSPGIYLEEILKLINQTLLKSKFLKNGTKQPNNTVSLSSSFETKEICWTCQNSRQWATNLNMNQFCCTLNLIWEDLLRVHFEVGGWRWGCLKLVRIML